MTNFARLEEQIKQDEGFMSGPYKDTVGVWTIGYGSTTLNGEPVTESTPAITHVQAQPHLRADIFQALIDCQSLYSNWEQIDSVRQECLANMAYNLGRTRLAKFKRMNAGIAGRDWTAARVEMIDSLWYRQVGGRAHRLTEAMRTGRWT